jgi:hypothetical protein
MVMARSRIKGSLNGIKLTIQVTGINNVTIGDIVGSVISCIACGHLLLPVVV